MSVKQTQSARCPSGLIVLFLLVIGISTRCYAQLYDYPNPDFDTGLDATVESPEPEEPELPTLPEVLAETPPEPGIDEVPETDPPSLEEEKDAAPDDLEATPVGEPEADAKVADVDATAPAETISDDPSEPPVNPDATVAEPAQPDETDPSPVEKPKSKPKKPKKKSKKKKKKKKKKTPKKKTPKPTTESIPVEPPEPVEPEPVVPEPVVPEPVVPEPYVPEPYVPEPVFTDPPVPEPVAPEYVVPDYVEPEPVVPEPVVPEPVVPEPVVPEPVIPEPVVPEPVVPEEPVAPEPVAPQPEEPKVVDPQPPVPEPVVPEPVAPQPEQPIVPEPKPVVPKPEEPKPEPPKPVKPAEPVTQGPCIDIYTNAQKRQACPGGWKDRVQILNMQVDKLKKDNLKLWMQVTEIHGKNKYSRGVISESHLSTNTWKKRISFPFGEEIKEDIRDCNDALSKGHQKPGVYLLNPSDSPYSVRALCINGWTVVQRRFDGSEDFNRDFDAYMAGFGNFSGEFILGLENLHRMTINKAYTLRVDAKGASGKWYYAVYDDFSLTDEKDDYRLLLGNMTAGNYFDGFDGSRDQQFSTRERDNDQWRGGNCAGHFGGGWWASTCTTNLNQMWCRAGCLRWSDKRVVNSLIRIKPTEAVVAEDLSENPNPGGLSLDEIPA